MRSTDAARSKRPPPREAARWIATALVTWWRRTADRRPRFPWREGPLDRYRALTTEILLQRTRAEAVAAVHARFFQRFPDARTLAAAPTGDVEEEIRSLGLLWRATSLRSAAAALVAGVEDDADALLAVPGLGPYAVGAYLSLHRGVRATASDSNVARVFSRFFGFEAGPETRRRKDFLALCDRLLPARNFRAFNYALLDLGREVCRPRGPRCGECPLAPRCATARASASIR